VLNEAAPGMNERERAALVAEREQLVDRVRASCAALADQAPGEFAALAGGTRAAVLALEALEQVLGAKVGAQAFLPDLKRTLERVLATVDRPAPAPAAAVEAPASGGAVTTPAPAAPAVGGVPGAITSRQEVVACLDRIIEFYDRTEPASPVPFLARRMRRMVPMDFLELMEDLAPSGLKEFRSLAGLSEDKKAATRTQGERT
jgi:type VI secretion system protein ImpA